MIRIINTSITKFKEIASQKRIICFCAGQKFREFCDVFHLTKRISYIVDNYKSENQIQVEGIEIPVISLEEALKKLKREDFSNSVLVITSLKSADEVLKQMEKSALLDGMETYIYELLRWEEEKRNFDKTENELIPRKIHYCWFGKGKMPSQFLANMNTWKKYCPDYEIICWNEDNYDISKNAYMKQAYEAGKWSFVSDYARIDIVHEHGGIYLDTDVELLKPLDELLRYKLFCGFENPSYVNFGLGFGAEKGNGILRDILDLYKEMQFKNVDGTYNLTACPFYQTQVMVKHGLECTGYTQMTEKFAAFSPEYFSPINAYGFGRTTENSFSVHQYAATWFDICQEKIFRDKMDKYRNVKKRMHKVSIIIPVYNTEQYLRKCLESVRCQTLEEIEIICVDDGSKDACPQILDEYARKDGRFRVIHKRNGGLVSARKAGVEAASGEYIGYVDSDDWIEPQMYERLYADAYNNNADLVTSGYLFEGNYITVHFDDVPGGLYDEENMEYLRENAIYNLQTKEVGIRGSLCCKLFRTGLLRKIQAEISEKLTFSEDKMCVLSYILQCHRVYVRKEAFYHYISHPSSMVHKANADYLISVNEVYSHFIKLYEHPDFTSVMRMQAEIYITELLYKGINSRMGFQNSNLLWLDPYYIEKIPENSKVLLYGGGELGEAYRRQLARRSDIEQVGCIDLAYTKNVPEELDASSLKLILEKEYDIILITVKNHEKADKIREYLVDKGIPDKKICWYEQKEVYWKYAESNGWLA